MERFSTDGLDCACQFHTPLPLSLSAIGNRSGRGKRDQECKGQALGCPQDTTVDGVDIWSWKTSRSAKSRHSTHGDRRCHGVPLVATEAVARDQECKDQARGSGCSQDVTDDSVDICESEEEQERQARGEYPP